MKANFSVMNISEVVVKIGLGPEKIQACMGFEPMTSVIVVQCTTNWADQSTGSWSLCWI